MEQRRTRRSARREPCSRPAAAERHRHPADALALAAVDRPRGQPRPGGHPAADLPPDHRRVRRRRRDDRLPRRVRWLRLRARSSSSYASLTRTVSRRRLLGAGGLAVRRRVRRPGVRPDLRASSRSPTSLSRIGGSPQHPVGNGLLAEQFPPERRGFAISAHIAGGNVGTVIVALIGAPIIAAVGWRGASIVFGIPADRHRDRDPAARSARPAPTGRRPSPAAASATAFRRIVRDRDLRWLYLTSVLGGGGRGLGVVNLFVLHLPDQRDRARPRPRRR